MEVAETQTKKHPYPKSVFFIIGNEFCERFCYYGLRTLLFLYLKNVLLYTSDDSTAINHGFVFLSYFFPLVGAILADSFLGKYRTILYLSLVYSLGCIVLSLGSVSTFGIPARELSLLGLLLIAIGTGGIKPCVSAFGGDQFRLPEQEKLLATFFSVFYFSINLGSVTSTYLTPILKKDVACFGATTCYPLAFGVPSVLMIVATVVFVLGKPFYQMKTPGRNIILEVIMCVKHALGRKMKLISEKKDHWLDFAGDKYNQALIQDVKALMGVIHMFIPVPLFWALFDQQTSRWIAQAEAMDGQLGSYYLLPEQMQAINPFLVLLFIPLFDYIVYPVLTKLGLLTKPLQRLGAGGVLAAIAFAVSALLEFKVETTYAVIAKPGEAQLRLFNSLDCDVKLGSGLDGLHESVVKSLGVNYNLDMAVNATKEVPVNLTCDGMPVVTSSLRLTEMQSTSYLIGRGSEGKISIIEMPEFDRVKKAVDQTPILRLIYQVKEKMALKLMNGKVSSSLELDPSRNHLYIDNLKQGVYTVFLDGKELPRQHYIYNGGVYTIMIYKKDNETDSKMFEVTPGNTVHILWQLPQIAIMTIAEVMFSITGLQFAFTQAPTSMKSVVASLWLLTTAFGNVIVAVIAESHLFSSQAHELLLFAGLMVIDMVVFILLAMRYKYKTFTS